MKCTVGGIVHKSNHVKHFLLKKYTLYLFKNNSSCNSAVTSADKVYICHSDHPGANHPRWRWPADNPWIWEWVTVVREKRGQEPSVVPSGSEGRSELKGVVRRRTGLAPPCNCQGQGQHKDHPVRLFKMIFYKWHR